MSIIICLDPGHKANYNQGANKAYYEGTEMYDYALKFKAEIEKYDGMSAVITRSSVNDCPSLEDRGAFANTKKASVFISLHSNACDTASTCYVVTFRSAKMDCATLGQKLNDTVVDLLGAGIGMTLTKKTVQTKLNSNGNDYYGVIRASCGGTVKYSFLIEHGFHTNYATATWLLSDANQTKLAAAEAKVLADYFGYKRKSTTTTTTTTTTSTDTKYTVVKGDSWWKISQTFYGSGLKYLKLAAYNNLSTSKALTIGQIIKIPKIL